jgi:hypothetical protein
LSFKPGPFPSSEASTHPLTNLFSSCLPLLFHLGYQDSLIFSIPISNNRCLASQGCAKIVLLAYSKEGL